jgi:SAM-dependent methyltransferase
MDDVRRSYDAVAADYAANIADELERKPWDRAYLDRLANDLRDTGERDAGRAVELGCGPGHVARYLHDRGVDISGLDFSQAMVEQARRLNPGMTFMVGDMLALPFADGELAGVVSFYSIIHFDEQQRQRALDEMARVLRPGGLVSLAFHEGSESGHRTEWWGHPVSFDFHELMPDEVANAADRSGLALEECLERDPDPAVEYPSRRAYLRLRRLAGLGEAA